MTNPEQIIQRYMKEAQDEEWRLGSAAYLAPTKAEGYDYFVQRDVQVILYNTLKQILQEIKQAEHS